MLKQMRAGRWDLLNFLIIISFSIQRAYGTQNLVKSKHSTN